MVIVVILVLGIGANTTMFTAFDAWVLRPLDFHGPDRLVALRESQPALGRFEISVSPRNLGDWLDQESVFDAVGVTNWRCGWRSARADSI
jgi:hypothetical protein